MVENKIYKTLDQELILKEFWESVSEINGVYNNRERRNIIYKHSMFMCARELTSLSLSSIGKLLNKDHATVLHAIRNHSINYLQDGQYRDVYDQMYAQLEQRMDKFNSDVSDVIERRLNNMDADVYRTTMISMYKKKIEKQKKAHEMQTDALKKEVSILRKQLKISRDREVSLNKECLRLKALL